MMTETRPTAKRSFPAGLLAALLLIAFAVRVFHLDFQSLWRDEVDAIRFSGGTLPQLLHDLTRAGHNGPLYFAVLHLWRRSTGDSEFALRYLSVVGGTLMVALTYATGRALRLKKSAALTATALIATAPYLLWYSQEAKMYSWLASLVLLAIFAFERAMHREKSAGWWALFILTTSLTFYTHILSPLMVGVYGAWALTDRRLARRKWRGLLLSLAMFTLPYLPLLRWQLPLLKNGFQSGHPFYPLPKMVGLLLHFYSVGILRWGWANALIGVMLALALTGLLLPTAPVRLRAKLALWWLLPVAAVYLISLRVTVFEDRYLIYILPAFFFSVGLGIVWLAEKTRGWGWGLLAVLLAFNLWHSYRQENTIIKADFRAAAEYIRRAETAPQPAPPLPRPAPLPDMPFRIYLPLVENHPLPVVMLQMPYLQYTFDYYFEPPFRKLDGLWTNDGRSAAEVGAEMTQLTKGVSSLWLVVAEEDQWDNRHLVRQWLNEHATLQDKQFFVGVSVYRYNLRQ